MSDVAAVQALLDQVAQGHFVTFAPGDYNIDAPLVLNYAANVVSGGFAAYGMNLRSSLPAGADMLTINVESGGKVVRGQRFLGLNLFGNKTDGNGLKLNCPSGSYLYNFVFRDMMIENFGGDGLNALGNIFEGEFDCISPRGNGGNGATLGNGPGGAGVMSSNSWRGGSCGQNAKCGMSLVNYFYDLSIRDTYFLENGSFGLATSNGISALSGKGFENNQQAGSGPAIHLVNFGTIGPVSCGGNNGKQTSLLDGAYIQQQTNLIGCRGEIGTINGKGVVNAIGCQTVPIAGSPDVHVVVS